MTDPAILFVKPKAISARDKTVLRNAGVIVVEVEDLNSVKFVRAHAELSGTEMLIAAAQAISKTGSYQSAEAAFGKAICAVLLDKKNGAAATDI